MKILHRKVSIAVGVVSYDKRALQQSLSSITAPFDQTHESSHLSAGLEYLMTFHWRANRSVSLKRRVCSKN